MHRLTSPERWSEMKDARYSATVYYEYGASVYLENRTGAYAEVLVWLAAQQDVSSITIRKQKQICGRDSADE